MLHELFYKLSNPSVTFYDLLPGGPFKPIIMTLGETLIWETGGTTAVDGVFQTDYIYISLLQNTLKIFKKDFFFPRSLYAFVAFISLCDAFNTYPIILYKVK